ncbi:MAG: carbon-nitrogen hydrolase family protein, partial [Bryobacteraceae bacterium]
MIATLRVAAACIESQPADTAHNLAKIREACGLARKEGARLLLFPELSLTGFIPNHPKGDHAAWLREALADAWRMAEPLDGPAVSGLLAVARELGLYLAAGLIENSGNVLYNTTVMAGPEGLLGAWRKLHVPMFEMPFYNGGPPPNVAATPIGRVGANICFDALLPESTRLLAVQQVEIVPFPFAADPPPGTAAAWAEWAAPAVRALPRERGFWR